MKFKGGHTNEFLYLSSSF